MRTLLFFVLCCAAAQAQTPPVGFYLDNSGGAEPISELQAFPSSYTFPNTAVGSPSSVGVRVVNTSTSVVVISSIAFVSGADQNSNFTSDLAYDLTLAPGGSQFFHIFFVPTQTATTSAAAQVGANGSPVIFSTIQGTGTDAQLSLTCSNQSVALCDGSILQPDEATAINFGNIPTSSSFAVTFTLTNGGTSSINPQQLVSLVTATNNPSTAFELGALPSSIAAGASGTFTVTFAPGNTNTQQVTLAVGSETFALQGSGTASVVGDIGSLQIVYTSGSGVNLTAQPATPISFGQIIAGTAVNPVLLFTVSNPSTTIDAVPVPSIAVAGAGFAISGTNPAPVSIAPGGSTTFSVMFSGATVGSYTGTLTIGSRAFSLAAQVVVSSLPTPSITVDQQPLLSQQQAHVTVQLAAVASVAEIGTLTMQFTPSVANVTDDPAIEFIATSGRQLQVSVASGAQAATYGGQSAISFQTGTTAGTITFTVQFPNQAAVTQTYTITPAQVKIASGTAVVQAPNLVLTLTGFDNTYSAGQLSFTFYSTSGQILNPTAISVDATSNFHSYFFGESQVGGAFSVQATFPTSGDPTQVGSVAVTLNNSAGQTSMTQAFQ